MENKEMNNQQPQPTDKDKAFELAGLQKPSIDQNANEPKISRDVELRNNQNK